MYPRWVVVFFNTGGENPPKFQIYSGITRQMPTLQRGRNRLLLPLSCLSGVFYNLITFKGTAEDNLGITCVGGDQTVPIGSAWGWLLLQPIFNQAVEGTSPRIYCDTVSRLLPTDWALC